MAKKSPGKENEFEKLARLFKEELEDVRSEIGSVRGEMGAMEKRLERHMDEGFASVNRRLDTIIQVQLEEHVGRIKKLEDIVFSR